MTPEETACTVKCRQSGIIRQLRHNYKLCIIVYFSKSVLAVSWLQRLAPQLNRVLGR